VLKILGGSLITICSRVIYASSKLGRTVDCPQWGADALYADLQSLTEDHPQTATINEPTLGDYARVVILFGAIWAICAGAAVWGLL
jgi:hypothetical protein